MLKIIIIILNIFLFSSCVINNKLEKKYVSTNTSIINYHNIYITNNIFQEILNEITKPSDNNIKNYKYNIFIYKFNGLNIDKKYFYNIKQTDVIEISGNGGYIINIEKNIVKEEKNIFILKK